MKKYDLSKIMKRAWKEAKGMAAEARNVVVEHFESYNIRRYSMPWVCKITEDGRHDFSERIGIFTGSDGDAGDLVIFHPVVGQVYGYGQKDYRRHNTIKEIVKWNGSAFVECDKLGKEK